MASRARGTKHRAWTITANVPDFIDKDYLQELAIKALEEPGVRYICFQEETAPSTGQKHYQGFVQFPNQVYLSGAKELGVTLFGVQCHMEPARGTADENRVYCSKEGGANFQEHGSLPRPGNRTDLARIARELTEGKSLLDVATMMPSDFMKYHGGIKAYHTLIHSNPRVISVDPIVYWWYGPTGVGKSRKAFETFPSAYIKMNNHWWDGYIGQKEVVFDDYRPSLCTFQEFLRIIDRYPMRVEVKGSSIELSANVFVVTTTSRPEVLWNGRTEEALNQLIRRIGTIQEFKPDGQIVTWKDSSTPYQMLNLEDRGIPPTFHLPHR